MTRAASAAGLLLIRGVVDARAVLRADVVALAHALGRVVLLEERLQQVGVGDLLGVERDQTASAWPVFALQTSS